MKIRELIVKLRQYKPDQDICLAFNRSEHEIESVEPCVDMDTNQVHCQIIAEE